MTTIFCLAKREKCSIITMEVNTMWWIYQSVAVICVTAALTFGRWYGLHYEGILLPWAVKVVIEIVAAYAFIKSFMLAPSFFQAWFLGTVLLSLFGFLVSLMFFGEVITMVKVGGVILALSGMFLLVL